MKKYNIILGLIVLSLMLYHSSQIVLQPNPSIPNDLFSTDYPVIIGFIVYSFIIGLQKVISD